MRTCYGKTRENRAATHSRDERREGATGTSSRSGPHLDVCTCTTTPFMLVHHVHVHTGHTRYASRHPVYSVHHDSKASSRKKNEIRLQAFLSVGRKMVILIMGLVGRGMFGPDLRLLSSPEKFRQHSFFESRALSSASLIENANLRFGRIGCCAACYHFRCPSSLKKEWPIFF